MLCFCFVFVLVSPLFSSSFSSPLLPPLLSPSSSPPPPSFPFFYSFFFLPFLLLLPSFSLHPLAPPFLRHGSPFSVPSNSELPRQGRRRRKKEKGGCAGGDPPRYKHAKSFLEPRRGGSMYPREKTSVRLRYRGDQKDCHGPEIPREPSPSSCLLFSNFAFKGRHLEWRIRRACSPLDACGAWQRSSFAECAQRSLNVAQRTRQKNLARRKRASFGNCVRS